MTVAAAARRSLARKPLALVVEDDPDAAEVAAGMLHLMGFQTRVAADGNAALALLATTGFDLVLLDVCLPAMDGLMLMQVAEQFGQISDTPVLAVSAVYSPEGAEARALRKLGVPRVLAKPFSVAALRGAVEELTGHPVQTPPPLSAPPPVPRPTGSRPARAGSRPASSALTASMTTSMELAASDAIGATLR